jgi:co-chaperonin GroES (HSP10)
MMPGQALILCDEEKSQSLGGILYADRYKPQDTYTGRVAMIGEPKTTSLGVRIPAEFELDDRVVFTRWAGAQFEDSETRENVVLVNFDRVMAIVE